MVIFRYVGSFEKKENHQYKILSEKHEQVFVKEEYGIVSSSSWSQEHCPRNITCFTIVALLTLYM